ncbi:pentatricopeptide repeat-containing protein At3g07290, mitochondrial isoform X2 [Pistacia vera]|uniref:pentatricopeptide repeat-containing protein At3g07290, mitochondrial isoform X2 n=1 Tax=Pistacia vera TaxID=55513 RepID=UPI0012635D3C|nr:pentatricopeptide repeat-containing protein At3g07290, mitochondrial isoform X2 [Pistacia vera]
MLIHPTKLTRLPIRLHVFQSATMRLCISLFSSQILKDPETTTHNIVYNVSTLLNKQNWQQNNLLKLLVSHMTPNVASQVVLLQGNNPDLGFRFFKWVCKQSTYCYDIGGRVHLLNLVVSSNLFGVAHKAIVELIKECSENEDDILKLMDALDGLRKDGFKLNYPCYSGLLMSLAKLNLGFVAYIVYRRMVLDGFVIGAIDYRTIINALCKCGLVQAAEMFLCRVLKLGFSLGTHICTSFVLGHCRENNLQEAFKVFEIMSKEDGCRPNSVTFSTLIHGLCEVGRLEEAFSLKEEMSEKGCQPSTRTYTVLIKALCDFALTDKALGLLDEMVVKGCKPNVHTYTVLIDRLCREGKIEEANAMFREMLQYDLFPGIVTYNVLINGYCKQGQIVAAFELLALMEKRNCKPNIRTFNELMEGLCRISKSYKAMHLLHRVVDNGLFPDKVAYNILVDGFCREGQLDMALKIFNSMSSVGLIPDGYTFTSMINGLCKQGRTELATGFFGLMIKKGIPFDEVAITALIDGLCKSGKTGDALMIFERMVEIMVLKSSHVLNLFLDVFSKENKLKEEYAMFGKILKYGVVPSVVTYTILIDGLSRAGEFSLALNMIKMMNLAGCPPNVYTYTVIINGLCQSGRLNEAQMLTFKMFDFGVSPNHITYTILVKAHVNAGRLDHALNIVSIMAVNGCQLNDRIFSALIKGLISSNKAIEVQSDGSSSHVDARPLRLEYNDDVDDKCVSNNVIREMDIEHARRLGDKIARCGGSITDLYNFLAAELCRAGRIAEADSITKDIVQLGSFPDIAISFIIEWYCKEVIQGLHNEGRSEEAERLVSDLLRFSGIEEKTAVLPYIDFLLKGDKSDKCLDLQNLIDQMHYRGRPVI